MCWCIRREKKLFSFCSFSLSPWQRLTNGAMLYMPLVGLHFRSRYMLAFFFSLSRPFGKMCTHICVVGMSFIARYAVVTFVWTKRSRTRITQAHTRKTWVPLFFVSPKINESESWFMRVNLKLRSKNCIQLQKDSEKKILWLAKYFSPTLILFSYRASIWLWTICVRSLDSILLRARALLCRVKHINYKSLRVYCLFHYYNNESNGAHTHTPQEHIEIDMLAWYFSACSSFRSCCCLLRTKKMSESESNKSKIIS